MRPGPRLRPGLAVADTATGPLIIGATRRYRFPSATAASLLARLLTLLDGNHDVADLSAECSMSAAEIERLLDKLRAYGLLEVPGSALAALPPQVATYFARMLNPAAQHLDVATVVRRLREADILLSVPRALADAVTGDLGETGVGAVTHHDDGRQGPHAAVIFGWPDVGGSLTRVVSALNGRGTPVLRCAASDGWMEIGPLFYPGYTACPGCFERGYQEAGWCPPAMRNDDELGDGATVDLLSGLVVQEILALLTGLGGSVSPRVVTRVNGVTFRADRYLVAPYPDCERCGWPQERAAEPLAMYYEWQMEELPPRLSPPRIFGLAADRQRQSQLTLEDPATSSHLPRRGLPGGGFPDPAAPRGRNGQLDDRLLAHLLTRLGDLTADEAGLELYLLTRRRRFGVPGTVCRYDQRTHQVIAVSADSPPVEVLLAGSDLDMRRLDTAIVFVGGIIAPGQENSACRGAHLLAGRCAAALWAMACSFRLHASFASRWSDSLAEALELRPHSEVIAALAGLGTKTRS